MQSIFFITSEFKLIITDVTDLWHLNLKNLNKF